MKKVILVISLLLVTVFISTCARRKEGVFLAGIDADAAKAALGEMGLGLPIALHSQKLERHLPEPALRILEGAREVAIDATLDLSPFRPHANGFGDVQGPVGQDGDRRVIAFDHLCRMKMRGPEGGDKPCRKHRGRGMPSRPSVPMTGSGHRPAFRPQPP